MVSIQGATELSLVYNNLVILTIVFHTNRLRKRKLPIRTKVRVPPRLPRPPRVDPRRVRPRRSHGPRSRLRISSTTKSSSIKNATRNSAPKSPRFYVSPELFSARSSRSTAPSLVSSLTI